MGFIDHTCHLLSAALQDSSALVHVVHRFMDDILHCCLRKPVRLDNQDGACYRFGSPLTGLDHPSLLHLQSSEFCLACLHMSHWILSSLQSKTHRLGALQLHVYRITQLLPYQQNWLDVCSMVQCMQASLSRTNLTSAAAIAFSCCLHTAPYNTRNCCTPITCIKLQIPLPVIQHVDSCHLI